MAHSSFSPNRMKCAPQVILLTAFIGWSSAVQSEIDCAKALQDSVIIQAKISSVHSVVERYRTLFDSSDRDIYPGARLRIKPLKPFNEVDRECLDRHVPIIYVDGFKFPQMPVRYLPVESVPEAKQGGDKAAGGTPMRVEAEGIEKPDAKSLLFDVIEFEMLAVNESRDIWLRLHNTPRPDRMVDVGIGFKVAANNVPADVELKRVKLDYPMHAGMAPLYGYHMAWIAFALSIACGVIASIYLWFKKDSPLKANTSNELTQGTVQAFAWFVLIAGMGIHLWILSGALPSISPTLLALMGVSGTTLIVTAKLNAVASRTKKPVFDVSSIQMWGFNAMVMLSFVIDSHQYLKLAAIEPTWAGVLGISNAIYLATSKSEHVL